MKRILSFIVLLMGVFYACYAAEDNSDAGSPVSKEGYILVFSTETSETASKYLSLSDEEIANCSGSFTDPETMESFWDYCAKGSSTWNKHMGSTVEEQQQNVAFDNGTIMLYASEYGNDWLSSGIQSKSSYKYGIFEIKAKCKAQTGNFPALWLMPSSPVDGSSLRSWPMCGEIDLMEMIDNSYAVYGSVHNGNCQCNSGKTGNYSGTYRANSLYHIYTLKWTENSLIWYIDGKQFYTYTRDASLTDATEKDNQWPFCKPFYMIVNQSVGDGSWASSPVAGNTYEMDVAYVRVYQDPVISGIDEIIQYSPKHNDAESYYNPAGECVSKYAKGLIVSKGRKYINR